MNKTPTVSIIIPAFNEADHLMRCLDAITKQTIPPEEVIVVNNNSTDHTVKVAKSFAGVTVINEEKQGIIYARNAGFNQASCTIIARIDADSVVPVDWVARIKEFYKNDNHTHHALSGGGYFYNIRTPKFNGWLQSQLAYRWNRFIIGHYILWGSNMAVPRLLWESVKKQACTREDIHEDMDLAIHLHKAGYEVTYDATLKVGVKLKRVWEDRWEQRKHMARWPRTLRSHGYFFWWLGSIGNVLLSIFGEPYIFASESIARLFRRHRLPQ